VPQNPLSLVVVGDVIPTRPLFPDGRPASDALGRVAELFDAADVAVGNLDSALTTRGYPREKLINVRANPDVVAPAVAQLGFDVISVANNHGTDYGATGLFDTLEALTSAGIQTVGGGKDLEAATAPAIVETGDWRVGVLAWTAVLPTGAAASAERPGLAPLHVATSYEVNPLLLMEEPATPPTVRSHVEEADLAAAAEVIARVRADVDFLVVLVHWGSGVSDANAEYQAPLGRALLDAGADVVVGSHPHRVLGIERHGDKAIFYSPGTLIEQIDRESVDPEMRPLLGMLSPDSFLATLEVAPDGGYGMRITPTTLDADGLPMVAEGEAFDRIAQRLVEFSAVHGTDVTIVEGGLEVALRAPATA
jgi:poly-gamma-glutamate capsule biosynthesis protein CapA/YwtB (metallophosphatase superfamily)